MLTSLLRITTLTRSCCLLTACIFIVGYIKLVISHPPIFHDETITTLPLMAISDGNFIIELPFYEKIKWAFLKALDVSITENGYYQPKILSFFLQYLDANMMLILSRKCPLFNGHFPGYWLSFLLLIIGFYMFFRKVFPTIKWQYTFCMATCFPLIPNYQISSHLVLSSAKLLTPSLCILLFLFFFLYHPNVKIAKNKYCIFFLVYFLGC